MKRPFSPVFFVILVALVVSGCGSISSPTDTPLPPTATPAPTNTPLPPTATPAPTDTPFPPTATPPPPTPSPVVFELTSPAFNAGEAIPVRYSCNGENISPPLEWSDPPPDTQSFVLIFEDPDAVEVAGYIWDHWIIFNLPAEIRTLPEAIPPDAELSDGSRHGQNSWQRLDYGGPCPPAGTHRYFFKLYALDTVLDLAAGASKEQLHQTMEGHILAQTELMGLYTNP